LQYCLISFENIFNLKVKISFALLSIKRVVNSKLIFELNLNYKKLSKNLFYIIKNSEINITNKQISNSNINLHKLKKSKINN